MQAGVPSHADIQPYQVQVGKGSARKVCLRSHLCQGMSRAPLERQRRLCPCLSTQEKGNHFEYVIDVKQNLQLAQF